ncbi:MAG: SpoIIE family protein phosphatase, partial [Armatimonadetes bacterium]|nr:SpoIIE family protein phosphatase [Armatimonadota bacterium]
VCYTDGLVEVRSPTGETYGEARMRAFVAAHAGEDPEVLGPALLEEVARFSGSEEPYDDQTVVVLKRQSGEE